MNHNIGFISTRFHGTDGVTLEAAKWAQVFEEMGHSCFWFAGKIGTPPAISFLYEKAFFGHPEIATLQKKLFGTGQCDQETTDQIQLLKNELKKALHAFVKKFGIELLIPQNVLAVPMHVPLGIAVTEFIAETGIPSISHHHDFAWERERFSKTCVQNHLDTAFPPPFDQRYENVVINSPAATDLAKRRNVTGTVIPNVYDFDNPPPPPDDYALGFRQDLSITEDDLLVLQPTRIVPRKGIELAIELLHQLQPYYPHTIHLVISHDAGDEGFDYLKMLEKMARGLNVHLVLAGDRVTEKREVGTYTLGDVYQNADLVTYPSLYEGFGNAFLEALYYRCPVVINRYPIYVADIEPLGFKTIAIDQTVTDTVVAQTCKLLSDKNQMSHWADHNYALATKHFSHTSLKNLLAERLDALCMS